MFTIELLDSVSSIQKKVNQACADHFNKNINRLGSSLVDKFKIAVESWLIDQPEIISLNTASPDSLMAQFGLPPAQAATITAQIIQAVKNSISIKIRKFDAKLNGGIDVNFQPKGFQNLLTLGAGHTIYDKGDLHWLDWLLTMGDTIIVAGYDYNAETGIGRSGLGNMKEGGAWSVPPEFSGTLENNFVTRALIGKEQEAIIAQIFKEVLS
jgi:hypothetical protein